MTKLHTNKVASRRAVAPVIAKLLLVAIAVVGGSIIFVFSQGFFSSAQISGQPSVESIEVVGYDMSDVDELVMHDGDLSSVVDGSANKTEPGNPSACTIADRPSMWRTRTGAHRHRRAGNQSLSQTRRRGSRGSAARRRLGL